MIQDRARGVTRPGSGRPPLIFQCHRVQGLYMMVMPMTVIRTVAVIVAVLVVMTCD